MREIIRDLAARAGVSVVFGPFDARALTVRVGATQPETALRNIARMAGLDAQRNGNVWYVGAPEWLASTLGEPEFTELFQCAPADTASLAALIGKALSLPAKVQTAGDGRIIVTSSLKELEAASAVASAYPSIAGKDHIVTASIAVDTPEAARGTLPKQVQDAHFSRLQVDTANGSHSCVLRGDPAEAVAGLRLWRAASDGGAAADTIIARE